MSLFFIGCSHTRGDDLVDPDGSAWPTLVAQAKNQKFLNVAVSGGTNERTVYQTIKHIDKFDKFYIAWTLVNRFTRYRVDNNFEVNFNSQLVNSEYCNDPSYYEYGKIHYTYWYNKLYAFKCWLQQIILLQRYLDSHSKKYFMLNTTDNNINEWCSSWQDFNNSVKSLLCFDLMNNDQLYAEHIEIQTLLKQINFEHFPGWGTWCIAGLKKSYPYGPTGHLLEQGHRAIADYILTHDKN